MKYFYHLFPWSILVMSGFGFAQNGVAKDVDPLFSYLECHTSNSDLGDQGCKHGFELKQVGEHKFDFMLWDYVGRFPMNNKDRVPRTIKKGLKCHTGGQHSNQMICADGEATRCVVVKFVQVSTVSGVEVWLSTETSCGDLTADDSHDVSSFVQRRCTLKRAGH